MKTLKKANLAFLLNIPTIIVYYVVLVVVGNIIYAYLAQRRCDPYEVNYLVGFIKCYGYIIVKQISATISQIIGA